MVFKLSPSHDKAVSHPITEKDKAQVIAYLAAMEAKVGLFFNFGRQGLEYHRILCPKSTEGWQTNIQQYLWQPDRHKTDPVIEKETIDEDEIDY